MYSVQVYNEDTLQSIFEACQTIRNCTGTFEIVKVKCKVHPCSVTEAMYRLYDP